MSVNANLQLYVNLPPNESMLRGEMEYRKENRAPTPKPGDKYPITGALIGVIIGVILGIWTLNVFVAILGVIIGGLAGTYIGSLVGNLLKKREGRNKQEKLREGDIFK